MPILQHYFTSCVNPVTRSAGFQTKAVSPGVQPEAQATLLKLIGYRIPPTSDERDIASHPVSLRYYRTGPDEAILACCQSVGADENGRPGNFFAHSLLLNTADFGANPPIAYWRNSLWRSADPNTASELPPLPCLDPRPTFTIDAVWEFLCSAERRTWFHALLSAVVDRNGHGRSIVILDRPDNVALWVAALSFALPKRSREALTFATYHHDPYQVPYLITGTLRDSLFRFSPQEYVQYFVLETESSKISDSAPSAYADDVAAGFDAQSYANDIEPLLAFCDRRLGADPTPDSRLNKLVHLYSLLGRDVWMGVSADDLDALESAVDGFEREGALSEQDAADLVATANAVREALAEQPDDTLVNLYRRACRVAARNDPSASASVHLRDDIRVLVGLTIRDAEAVATHLLAALDETYGAEAVSQAINDRNFQMRLAGQMSAGEAYESVWRTLGPRIELGPPRHPVVEATFQELDIAAAGKASVIPEDAQRILAALQSATRKQPEVLLEHAAAWARGGHSSALSWIYYAQVRDLPLDRRAPLRRVVESAVPGMFVYELESDLQRVSDPSRVITTLDAWLAHLPDPARQATIVGAGLTRIWELAPQAQLPALARQILSLPMYADHLDAIWEPRVVQTAFSNLELAGNYASQLQLFERYLHHPALSEDSRGLMGLCMALARGNFDEESAPLFNQRLKRLDAEQYGAEAQRLIARYCSARARPADYVTMVGATYVLKHEAIFWKLHWDAFDQLFRLGERPSSGLAGSIAFRQGPSYEAQQLAEPTARWLVAVLDFWFDSAIERFGQQPYVVQQFFLGFPGAIATAQDAAGWKLIASALDASASRKAWYAIIRDWLQPRSGLSRFFHH